MGISNLKWLEAMAEVKAINEANTFFSRDESLADCPETLKPDQLAVLQRPYRKTDTLQAGKTAAFREWIESACLAGILPHIKGKEVKHRERKIPTGTHLHEAARRLTEDTSYEVDVCRIKACDFAELLASEGEEPSVHLAAWIKATVSESPALPAEAADAPGGVEPDKAGPGLLKAETVPDRSTPVVAIGTSDGFEKPIFNFPWWRVEYDIDDMAQNIGATLHGKGERTSNTAIAKEIEKRINDNERRKARDRSSPNWDTIRGVLTDWAWRPK